MSERLEEEVSLLIEDHAFKVKKEMLCEHSDYFRAMFSGSYVENEKQEIKIDMVDAESMKIILNYMEVGLIDLTEYPLSTIGELAVSANFLQITELIKQIQYTLDIQTNEANWIEIMKIAENCSYKKLESFSCTFGLLSFNTMKPEHIASIEKLYWYLSHPYLHRNSELAVFKFGLQWISQKELDADAVLVILYSLDVTRLTELDLQEMSALTTEYSLAIRIIECLLDFKKKNLHLSLTIVIQNKPYILENYSERVFSEVSTIVKESKPRMLNLTPVVPMWVLKNSKPDTVPHFLYTYCEKNGFEKWLEVADESLWGWSIAAWTPTKMVVVCGEHGRGTGNFMKDVKVYDTLRREWTHHGVNLPPRRHAGLTVIGDTLYIVGGVGGFRIILDTAISYNLKERSFRRIAKLRDTIQNPAVCSHKGSLFAAGHKHIFQYVETKEDEKWVVAIESDIRSSCLISFRGFIYSTQNYFSHLYRFKPGVDTTLEMFTYFTNPPAAICDLGEKLIVFTRTMCGQSDILAVEEFRGDIEDEKPKVLFSESGTIIKVNDVSGACAIVLETLPLDNEIPEHHKTYLKRYTEN